LPRSPVPDHRRYWYCVHNPTGQRRDSQSLTTAVLGDDTTVPESVPVPPGINPLYCDICPDPTQRIPLLSQDFRPSQRPTKRPATNTANTAASPPPHVHALLPTFPPLVHPRTHHHSRDTATNHSSSQTSSTHQRHVLLLSDQEDHGITVSEAYWPAGIEPKTDMPGKPSEIHVSSGSLERQHVGAGDSFMELSETTVSEKARRMLHQLLETFCL
jgi:hypothetical protein